MYASARTCVFACVSEREGGGGNMPKRKKKKRKERERGGEWKEGEMERERERWVERERGEQVPIDSTTFLSIFAVPDRRCGWACPWLSFFFFSLLLSSSMSESRSESK